MKNQLIEVVSTHTEAATYMLRQRVDNALEAHIDRALDASGEYRALCESMPQDMPDALESYQSEFSDHKWAMADMAIKTYGVEIAVGQFLFHGGHWASNSPTCNSPTITTSRPFSTSFCPQVALRNAEWKGKAYDAGRVDLMVVCVTQPKTKAYAYSRESQRQREGSRLRQWRAANSCTRNPHHRHSRSDFGHSDGRKDRASLFG